MELRGHSKALARSKHWCYHHHKPTLVLNLIMADHVDTRYTKFFQTPKSESETDEHLQSYTDHKHLISTLPRKTTDAKMPEEAAIYSFHGFSFPPHILLAILSSQKHFKPLPDDIFLTTYPKSGTTWIKALAFAILNRRSFPCNDTNHPLLTTNPQELIPHFEDLFMRGPLVPDLTVMARPRMFSSHIPYSLLPDSNSRIVYVSRDPKDVLVSFVNFFNKSRSNLLPDLTIEKAVEAMVGAEFAYDPIWEHQAEYKRESLRRPDKVLFLKYEEMLENPLENVRNLAGFLGQPFTAEEGGVMEEIVKLCSFDFLKELKVNKEGFQLQWEHWTMKNSSFFRKGKVGDWKEHLTPEMAEKMDRNMQERMSQFTD